MGRSMLSKKFFLNQQKFSNKFIGNFIFENFQIDGAAFISALGGALSLFLGISISMVFEVIEFVIDLTLNICLLCGKGKKKVDDSEKGKHFFFRN